MSFHSLHSFVHPSNRLPGVVGPSDPINPDRFLFVPHSRPPSFIAVVVHRLYHSQRPRRLYLPYRLHCLHRQERPSTVKHGDGKTGALPGLRAHPLSTRRVLASLQTRSYFLVEAVQEEYPQRRCQRYVDFIRSPAWPPCVSRSILQLVRLEVRKEVLPQCDQVTPRLVLLSMRSLSFVRGIASINTTSSYRLPSISHDPSRHDCR